MGLSNLQRIFYRSLAEKRLLDHEGQAFEDFFVDIARRFWGDDFEPIRAYGRHGDLKCDGRRISTGTIFQCYAPRTPDSSAVHSKVKGDFNGALSIWKDKMQAWSITINDRQGLDALATQAVELLRAANSQIRISTLLPSEIVSMVLSLNLNHLADIFGYEVSERDTALTRVAFSDLGVVIDSISGMDPTPTLNDIGKPSPNKIEINELGPEIRGLLRQGDLLASHVDSFFRETGRVELGERISETMKGHYTSMKNDGMDPTQVFHGLIELCGGLSRPKQEGIALLAVIAYYFHRCDLFENA
jgi:hypothetical protein